jgi:hypothetical protein
MTNQRPGKMHAAAMNDTERLDVRSVIKLMSECAKETEGDTSFYFEQVVDYFQNQYRPGKGVDSASCVLGL